MTPGTKADPDREQEVLDRLIRRSARGDWHAFSILYAMTSPRVFGLMLHMTDYSDSCEDLLQDVYLKVWKQADLYRPDRSKVTTWLNAIARNHILDWLRHQRSGMNRLTTEQSSDAVDLAGGVGPEDEIQAIERENALARCMDELSESQRQAIFLAYRKGLTHSEMVQRLGSPLGTVKSWVRRGIETLRHCLRHSEGAP